MFIFNYKISIWNLKLTAKTIKIGNFKHTFLKTMILHLHTNWKKLQSSPPLQYKAKQIRFWTGGGGGCKSYSMDSLLLSKKIYNFLWIFWQFLLWRLFWQLFMDLMTIFYSFLDKFLQLFFVSFLCSTKFVSRSTRDWLPFFRGGCKSLS